MRSARRSLKWGREAPWSSGSRSSKFTQAPGPGATGPCIAFCLTPLIPTILEGRRGNALKHFEQNFYH